MEESGQYLGLAGVSDKKLVQTHYIIEITHSALLSIHRYSSKPNHHTN